MNLFYKTYRKRMETLPYEGIFEIALELPAKDVLSLCVTNKNLSEVCDSEWFWKEWIRHRNVFIDARNFSMTSKALVILIERISDDFFLLMDELEKILLVNKFTDEELKEQGFWDYFGGKEAFDNGRLDDEKLMEYLIESYYGNFFSAMLIEKAFLEGYDSLFKFLVKSIPISNATDEFYKELIENAILNDQKEVVEFILENKKNGIKFSDLLQYATIAGRLYASTEYLDIFNKHASTEEEIKKINTMYKESRLHELYEEESERRAFMY